MLNSSVLRWCLNDVSDGTTLSKDGRVFQAHAAATGKARSPSVDRLVIHLSGACLPVTVKWLAVKTASEMTYTVSGGALNSTQSNTTWCLLKITVKQANRILTVLWTLRMSEMCGTWSSSWHCCRPKLTTRGHIGCQLQGLGEIQRHGAM